MSKQNLTLGFIRKRKADRLQEFKDGLQVGMLADDVLKFAGKKLIRYTRGPMKISENDFGYIVNWFYPGIILRMEREEKIGPYKISNIEMGEIVQS